jgi:hypothetical protein
MDPLAVFTLGAKLENSELCLRALSKPNWTWYKDSDETVAWSQNRAGRPTIDPSTFPLSSIADIPTSYLWALIRAWDQCRPRSIPWNDDVDRKQLTTRFFAIMDSLKQEEKAEPLNNHNTTVTQA